MLKLPMAKVIASGDLAKARWGALIGRMRGAYQGAKNAGGIAGGVVGTVVGEKAAVSKTGRRLAARDAEQGMTRARRHNEVANGWMMRGSQGAKDVYMGLSQRIRNSRQERINDSVSARRDRWGEKGGQIGERIGRAAPAAAAVGAGAAAVSAGTSELSEAQIEQRREAAKARWAKG